MPDIEAALREFVRLRAAGLCEYRRISERFTLAEHEIDHIVAHKNQRAPNLTELRLSRELAQSESSLAASVFPSLRTPSRESRYLTTRNV
jgi:hypothetical protein